MTRHCDLRLKSTTSNTGMRGRRPSPPPAAGPNSFLCTFLSLTSCLSSSHLAYTMLLPLAALSPSVLSHRALLADFRRKKPEQPAASSPSEGVQQPLPFCPYGNGITMKQAWRAAISFTKGMRCSKNDGGVWLHQHERERPPPHSPSDLALWPSLPPFLGTMLSGEGVRSARQRRIGSWCYGGRRCRRGTFSCCRPRYAPL